MKLKNPENISTKERVLLSEAEKFGVTWTQIDSSRLFRLAYRGINRYFFGGFSGDTGIVGYQATIDKRVTRALLIDAGVAVAPGFHFTNDDSEDLLTEAFEKLQKPVVVKMSHGNNGNSVFTSLSTHEDFVGAVKKVKGMIGNLDQGIVVEQQVDGNEYRITLTKEKVLAVMARIPANIVGDGVHTIHELVDIKNADPLRNMRPEHNDPYPHIKIDTAAEKVMEKQGYTSVSIPKKGTQVFLREVSNLSQGGDSVDLTDSAHPSVKEIALQAINAIPNLTFAGLDFMTEDVTKPQSEVKHYVIEINAGPHFSIHHYPMQGKKRNVARELLFILFPELEQEGERML